MSTKEATGTKKDKSFNGSKGKFAPNPPPPAPDKKEVKLSRKESEKVKQANDSTRKSVLGRFFHNLVDSDDSRKKSTSVDAKKKRSSKDLDASGADLDLPEHGIILRKSQTLQRNPEAVPNARIRAATLSNQGVSRDNRNRWSSYDIHGTRPTEASLSSLPATQQDSMTLSCRSLSDETLNAPLAADQDASKSPEGFEIINHSDAKRQPDTLRKHAQLLKTIQEQQSNRATRSEKLNEIQGGRAANGWLLSSGAATTNGQGQNVDSSSHVKDTDPNSSVLKNFASDVVDGGRKSLSENSASLTLLEMRSKEIDKALSDKRRILSNLFKTPEEDMEQLTEKDAELSGSLTVHRMILMSLLHSDRLTSVINNSLIPRKNSSPDGAVDKEVSNRKGNKSHNEQKTETSLNIGSLQSAAVRLHQNLKLLTDMVSQEVSETDRLKKELNEAQNRLKQKKSEKTASEAKPEEGCDSLKIRQEVTNTSSSWNASTEIQGHDAEQLSKELEVKLDLNDVATVGEPVNMQIERETASVLETGWHNSEEAIEMAMRSSSKDKDKNPCIEEQYDSEDIREEDILASALKAEATDLFSTAMQETTRHDSKVPLLCKTGNTGKTVESNLVFQQDDEINTVSFYDSTLEIQDEEEDSGNVKQSDVNRKFRNLESIPEDDDRLSVCDFEQKVVFNDDSNDNSSNHAVHHVVGNLCTEHDDGNIISSLDVDSDKLSDTEDDSLPSLKTIIHSEMNAVSPSDVETGSGLICVGNDSLQSDTGTDDKMASEAHAHSIADSIIHDLKNCTDSKFDVVQSEVKAVVDANGDVLNAAVSKIHLVGQNADDHVKSLINLPGIEIDKKKHEENLFLKNEVGQSAGEDADDLNSKNEKDSESELKYEGESDIVAALLRLELDRITEPHLLLDVHSHEENILKPKTGSVIELDETMITEDKIITKTGVSFFVENPNLDTIPENSGRTQLNKDSSYVDVSDDQKENPEIGKSGKLLSREQNKEQFEKETVDFDGMDSGNCNWTEADVLSE